jgi:hypothetical protein
MTRNPESTNPELPRSARRVRIPEGLVSTRLFAGWGPELGR